MQRTRDPGPPTAPADGRLLESSRGRIARSVLFLYLGTLSIDAVRKVTGAPASIIGVVYILTAIVYITTISGTIGRKRSPPQETPRTLPVWLFMLSLWCLVVALAQHVPFEIALLGWTSYVYFVPLLYVGAELAADNRLTVKALRLVTISGVVVSVGAIASAILGKSAPPVLQPIVPGVGIHSFSEGNVYLSPSIFATAEEAAEQLLIALFAWAALAHLPDEKSQRKPSVFVPLIIVLGLIVAARRADLYVAIGGIIAALLVGRMQTRIPLGHRAPRNPAKPLRRLGAATFLAALGAVAFVALFGQAKLAHFIFSGSTPSRIVEIFYAPSSGSVLGQGPGTSTQGVVVEGAQAVGSGAVQGYILDGRAFLTVEGGLSKTWLELGIMGVALYGAVFWTALAPAIGSLRRLDGAGVAFTMLAIALAIIFLKGHQSLDDPLIQPLFWLTVGGIWGRKQGGRAHRAAG